MADETNRDETKRQHLEWLLEGVEAWNARRARDNFTPDFAGVDIRRAFDDAGKLTRDGRIPLQEANLGGANLRGANLTWADLKEANLTRADLTWARLSEAILDGTDLEFVNLDGANLREANLIGARLRKANLRGAKIEGTNFTGTDFREANLREAILTGAKLEGAILAGTYLLEANVKSVLNPINSDETDFTDLSLSLFLTQAQLDSMLGDSGTIIPGHLTRPGHWSALEQPPSPDPDPSDDPPSQPIIFLSYASQDRDRIGALHAFLSAQNLPFWWDRDIPAGASWRGEIAERLAAATAVLTLWTEDSTQSDGVKEEAASAQKTGKLVHARLDDAPLPYGFAETQYVDLRRWDGSPTHPEMRKLIQALRDKLDQPTREQTADRLERASSVAMEPRDGKLSPVDTPAGVLPEVDNSKDRQARLDGLRQSLASVQAMAADRNTFQLPPVLYHCLDKIDAALSADPPTWYGLEDSADSLSHCMTVHDAAEAWNNVIVQDLLRIVRRIRELQPLLQPRQVPPGEPDAKPPEPDPVIRKEQVAAVVDLAEQVEREVETAEAGDTLDSSVIDLLRNQAANIKDASEQVDDERKLPRLRGALRRLAYLTGGIIGAVGTGATVNLLTGPEAAATLAQRLTPIFEAILKFFL